MTKDHAVYDSFMGAIEERDLYSVVETRLSMMVMMYQFTYLCVTCTK